MLLLVVTSRVLPYFNVVVESVMPSPMLMLMLLLVLMVMLWLVLVLMLMPWLMPMLVRRRQSCCSHGREVLSGTRRVVPAWWRMKCHRRC